MAEAFAKIHGGESVATYSAGSKPSGVVNPKAIAAMAELGYDLSQHKSMSLSEIPDIQYDFVATMGCGDACPYVSAKARGDWSIPDPRNMNVSEFRAVRDEIEAKVKSMLQDLGIGRGDA
ncbi:MAG: arsenate reductase ArsC [Symploca sp. SIO2G7]|nr:arsenate reductase ArsC [Symploca sp. SIO2G7]